MRLLGVSLFLPDKVLVLDYNFKTVRSKLCVSTS